MKKIFILFMIITSLISCKPENYNDSVILTREEYDALKNPNNQYPRTLGEFDVTDNGYSETFRVILVDSCEYITSSNISSHKGNCVFCEIRRNKEYEKIINEIVYRLDKNLVKDTLK